MATTRRYTEQTYEYIMRRMLDRVDSALDKREGSVIYDMLAPAAAELAQAYIELQNVVDFGFLETSYGEYVDYRASELGLTRKPATFAKGDVELRGKAGRLIPYGTIITTNHVNPTFFTTQYDVTLGEDGKATVLARAMIAGMDGNVEPNKVTVVRGDMSGTVYVNNLAAFEGGADEESDADLIERYLEKIARPNASGNINDYIQWARETEGVGEAKCFPLWNGNGTVKVVITDMNRQTPTQEIIDACKANIEVERPVGADVTVVGAVPVPINISTTLILEQNKTIDEARAEIDEVINYYLSGLAFEDTVVRYTYIAALILQCDSVLDYVDLLVNGIEDENVVLNPEEIPIIGTVTLV